MASSVDLDAPLIDQDPELNVKVSEPLIDPIRLVSIIAIREVDNDL
jgi:hypothetical protein